MAEPQSADARSRRWVVILLASLLLHLLAFNWANGHIGMPSWRDETQTVITTALLTEPKKIIAPPSAGIAKPKLKPKPKRRHRAAPPPVQEAQSVPAPVVVEPTDILPEAAGDAVAADTPQTPPPEASIEPAPPANETQAAAPYKIDPPPSAELTYDVFALRDEQKWYGSGAFRWESAGGNYRVTGEASISLFFKITVLNFSSEGMINDTGIAPVLYSEKPWRKSLTNTHFQHEQRKISFSASEAVYPYKGGEQDRASVIWQLASIGRGDPGQFQPGAEMDVVVAGPRDADTWRIQVIGEEEIETPYGKLAAWHVVRTPRPESHDQKIDIWLASQREWYPVKVRYTYASGDFLDMALSSLTPLAH
ncbi:MAG TPA: DUF3108 domain-containing protein [Noviherbaspirillum sp.]|nr:DUF3108 domain-containing protein [Noviherbaspirillum sp.]